MPTRLERSTTNKVVAGVCGGIADYLQVDPTLVRVFVVAATILSGGLGLLAYVGAVIFMPLPGQPTPFVKTTNVTTSTLEGAANSGEPVAATPIVRAPEDPEATERRRASFGLVLIALGAIFLLSNAGVFRIVRWDLAWPLVFIAIGVLLLAQRVRR
jgi:phage shock protein C